MAATDQLAKLVGKVGLGEKALHAPLTGMPCACYSLTIDDTGSEEGGRLVDVNEGVPFWLKDGNASIGVLAACVSTAVTGAA